jgi:hypothetical protein
MDAFELPVEVISLTSTYKEQKEFILSRAKNDLILDLALVTFDSAFHHWLEALLQKLSSKHKSRVIVLSVKDQPSDSNWVMVPTVKEAHDLIEMDRIERDLGF